MTLRSLLVYVHKLYACVFMQVDYPSCTAVEDCPMDKGTRICLAEDLCERLRAIMVPYTAKDTLLSDRYSKSIAIYSYINRINQSFFYFDFLINVKSFSSKLEQFCYQRRRKETFCIISKCINSN